MSLTDSERALLLEGIERFNAGRFWDAHESWETIWLNSTDPTRRFLQGMIQLAAAFHHFKRGTLSGGIRLTEAAESKLSDFPLSHMGIDRGFAMKRAREARLWASEQIGAGNDRQELSPERFPRLHPAP
ncbi:MAG: DUF309 domain-containing protein [Thermoanaerobaculia bacterium]|nr:DUF309 domain-containing protein [Thermoanaerobaculia bacterium]